ncbi:MAG: RluA family pseudouridine synthase [Deltaproteobacteria bacterium]|nr:RluA family pseudouridine synthase [Deltaproteobacteria bacterium]
MDNTPEEPIDKNINEKEASSNAITIIVDESHADKRLESLLAELFPAYSRASMEKAIYSHLVSVDDKFVKASFRVKAGNKLIFIPPTTKELYPVPTPELPLEVLYQDEHFLVINKKAKLITHPGFGTDNAQTLAGAILGHFPELAGVGEPSRPGIVHRLDKDTSGVIIVARTQAAWEHLGEAFSNRETGKVYLAFVLGNPPKTKTIESEIGRHPIKRQKMTVLPSGGKEAKTSYRVLKRFPKTGVTLLSIRIFTGRTHQVRVHMSSIKYPILGDKVYGAKMKTFYEKFPTLQPIVTRQFLHARRLAVPDLLGERKKFSAPWPEDFKLLFQELSRLERAD